MRRINKNKTILRKLSRYTIGDTIQWIYLGETTDNDGRNLHVFISSRGIYGNKHVVFELYIYTDPKFNKLNIYMQNYKSSEKTPIKVIQSSNLLKSLCEDVINNVMSYNDDFTEVYDILTKSGYLQALIKK